MLTFKESVASYWSNYAIFSGRATRSEYWWSFLHIIIISLLCQLLDFILIPISESLAIFSNIFLLATILPTFSITVRRLHDIGVHTYVALALYIPSIIISLYYNFFLSEEEVNQWIYSDFEQSGGRLFAASIIIVIVTGIILFVMSLIKSGDDNQYGLHPFVRKEDYYNSLNVQAPIYSAKENNNNLSSTKVENLKQLNQLRLEGALSEEEFEILKKKELGL